MRKIYLKQNICFLPEYKSIVFFNSKNTDLEIEQIKEIGVEEPLIRKNISYIKNLIPLSNSLGLNNIFIKGGHLYVQHK